MTKRTLGIIATVVGSAMGAWWLTAQRRSRSSRTLAAPRERGTVIFDNTPAASGAEGII
jgi:hypothetical protein